MKKRTPKKSPAKKKPTKKEAKKSSLPLPQFVDQVVLVAGVPVVEWKEAFDPHFYYASDPDTGGMYGIKTDKQASAAHLNDVLRVALTSGNVARPKEGQIVAIPYSTLIR